MAITNRGAVRPGVELVSTYKGGDHRAQVAEDGYIVLADGGRFRSLSGAAASTAGVTAMNGWAFWTLVDQALDTEDAGDDPVRPEPEPAAEVTPTQRRARLIRAYDPMKLMDDGRHFCDACMRAVTLDAEGRCPIGEHTRDEVRAGVMGTEPVEELVA